MTGNASAVVLLSGGLDSSVLVHHVVHNLDRAPVYALSFHYGQRHHRELDCAAHQARAAGAAEHRVIDIAFFGELVKGATALVDGGADVPDLAGLAAAQRSQPPTYVPNRNMMLLALAAAYAEARGTRALFYGAQAQDEYGYWDCTARFLARINDVLALNRGDRVEVFAPFVTLKKAGILALGLELGVDFAHTWSCYRGGSQPCRTCPTCVERAAAFREAGCADPLTT